MGFQTDNSTITFPGSDISNNTEENLENLTSAAQAILAENITKDVSRWQVGYKNRQVIEQRSKNVAKNILEFMKKVKDGAEQWPFTLNTFAKIKGIKFCLGKPREYTAFINELVKKLNQAKAVG